MPYRLRFLGNLPKQCYIALSGGPDSMAVLDFLIRGRRNVSALYFNHGTDHGNEAERFVDSYCKENGIKLYTGHISRFRSKNKRESPEAYWRDARYKFFSRFRDKLLITGHQLDDQLENWVFTSLRGNPRLIPYRRGNVIRPFLLTKSSFMEGWCREKNVPFVVDPSNSSDKYMRSYIRTNMIDNALVVNPGFYKTISKRVVREYNELPKRERDIF